MTDVTINPTRRLYGSICAPSSKSYTQRMLISASLAKGSSKIFNPLLADDTKATLRAISALGAKVFLEPKCWTVEGNYPIEKVINPINCGESGATLRFMIPIAGLALTPALFIMDDSLAKRPILPLITSLKDLGVEASVERVDSKKIICVEGGGLKGGKTSIPGNISSQFISGLMFACPLGKFKTDIHVTSPIESKSYALMTQEVISRHGVQIYISDDFKKVQVPSGQTYHALNHEVPGDFSSSAFLLAAAAITSSKISIKNLDSHNLQGDRAILDILKLMGVEVVLENKCVKISSDKCKLTGVTVNVEDIPDLVPVIATLACYANGVSEVYGAKRLRLKESNRLTSLYTELRKMGAQIKIGPDSLIVNGPCKMKGALINSQNDHRIAMACSVAALGASGKTLIQKSECVHKSYPNFFIDLKNLGADIIGGEFNW